MCIEESREWNYYTLRKQALVQIVALVCNELLGRIDRHRLTDIGSRHALFSGQQTHAGLVPWTRAHL